MIIRVHAKTKGDEYRQLTIAPDGTAVRCDCRGFQNGFCAHIDAVLVAGERAMVADEDHAIADAAMILVTKVIVTPENWKASWRDNRSWRGLTRTGARRAKIRAAGKPIVCFTGGKNAGQNRAAWMANAHANGWETINSASRSTDVLVADDVCGSSGKLKAARQNGTMVVSYDDWRDLMMDGVLPESDQNDLRAYHTANPL